jgi:hypothetical protein
MNELLKSKIRIRLVIAIEAMFEDEDLVDDIGPFMFSDAYSTKMANAALEVLDAQKDLYDYLLEENELKP